MPSTGLRGPFSLTTEGVNRAVTYAVPGAYALGYVNESETFVVQYVGRSDDDLNDRLLQHVPEYYRHFKFGYYRTDKDAFEKECNLYHDFHPPDNKVHPARPKGKNWECPRCTIFD